MPRRWHLPLARPCHDPHPDVANLTFPFSEATTSLIRSYLRMAFNADQTLSSITGWALALG
jgi:hypothetical protein